MTSQPGSKQQTDLACMRVALNLPVEATRSGMCRFTARWSFSVPRPRSLRAPHLERQAAQTCP